MGLVGFLHSYEPSSIIFQVGPVTLHWYGLLLAVGILTAYILTRVIWLHSGKAIKELDELLFWLVLVGLVGARVVDIFFYEWWYFKDHLWEIFYIWQGGLAWHGGLLGGTLFLWWWSRQKKYSLIELLDIFAPGLALGQAIGRWGNYFNQELFGLPTNLPWGIPISATNRPVDFVGNIHFHPTFLYESLALCLVALVLWYLAKKLWPQGSLFSLYLICTGIIRFLLEFIRVDEQNTLFSLRAGLWISLISVLIGGYLWLKSSKNRAHN